VTLKKPWVCLLGAWVCFELDHVEDLKWSDMW
jgi:hypothetical protein